MADDVLRLRPFFDRFKLKFYRTQRALSQRMLGEDSGVGSSSDPGVAIGLYERGQRQPHLSTIGKLAEALDVRPEQLMSTEEELIQTELRYEQAMLAREMLRDEAITRHSEHLSKIHERRAARKKLRAERMKKRLEGSKSNKYSDSEEAGADKAEAKDVQTNPSRSSIDDLYNKVLSQDS